MADYYATLGVSRGASLSEVRAAVRRLQLRCHPDKGGSKERSAAVNAAAEVLTNTARRASYDRWLRTGLSAEAAARAEAREHQLAREAREAREEAELQRSRREEEVRRAHAEAELERARREQAAELERTRQAERRRVALKGFRRRATRDLQFPFVPAGAPEAARMGELHHRWWLLRACGEAGADAVWAEAKQLKEAALDRERAAHFPRSTPKFKREHPEEAEAIAALHKRYRAVKNRMAPDSSLLEGICREAWGLQGCGAT